MTSTPGGGRAPFHETHFNAAPGLIGYLGTRALGQKRAKKTTRWSSVLCAHPAQTSPPAIAAAMA